MNKMINIKVAGTDNLTGKYLVEISYKKCNINKWLLEERYAVKKMQNFDPKNFNKTLLHPKNLFLPNNAISGEFLIE